MFSLIFNKILIGMTENRIKNINAGKNIFVKYKYV